MFIDEFLALCEKKEDTPSSAAKNAGFSRSLVSKWKNAAEKGVDVTPSVDVLMKICKYFNVSITELVGTEQTERLGDKTNTEADESIKEKWALLTPKEQASFLSLIDDVLRLRGQ